MLKKILFTFSATFLSFLFLMSGIMIPLAPYPLLVLFHTQGYFWIFISGFIYGCFYFLSRDLFSALLLAFSFLLTIVLYFLSLSHQSLQNIIVKTILILIIFSLGVFFLASYMHLTSIEGLIFRSAELLSTMADKMKEFDPANASQFMEIKSNSKELARNFIYSLPAYFIMTTAFTSWINLILLSRHKNLSFAYANRASLAEFRTPFWILVPFVIALGVFTYYYGQQNPFEFTTNNLLRIILVPYFFQGLSVTLHYCYRLRLGNFLKTMIICLFFYPMLPVTLVIGVLDPFFDFRKKRRGKNNASHT